LKRQLRVLPKGRFCGQGAGRPASQRQKNDHLAIFSFLGPDAVLPMSEEKPTAAAVPVENAPPMSEEKGFEETAIPNFEYASDKERFMEFFNKIWGNPRYKGLEKRIIFENDKIITVLVDYSIDMTLHKCHYNDLRLFQKLLNWFMTPPTK